jgi:uncharacterized membrane protein YeaQ/YmgE (transglycosylase-associated protein family)
MSLSGILVFLIIGAIAGWLAGVIFKGSGFGLAWNIIIGIAGAFVGGFLFRLVGIFAHSMIGSIGTALAGALILLFVIGKIKR